MNANRLVWGWLEVACLIGFTLPSCSSSTNSAGAATGGAGSSAFGGAGSSALGGTGTSGAGATTVNDAHCSPGQSLQFPYPDASVVYCYDPPYSNSWQFEIPNSYAIASAETYVLPTPLVAGATNAFSFDMSGNAPDNYEIWGTDSNCGSAQELLWWGPTANGVLCAEFTPTKAYSRLLFIDRQMYAVSNYAGGGTTIRMCSGGTCPAGAYGEGKKSNTTLTAPLGNYTLNRFNRTYAFWDITVGFWGNMLATLQGYLQDAGTAQPLSAGVFRMPSTDPYGDAWYCMGAGSALTVVNDSWGQLSHVNFSLRGITRLGDCATLSGTNALSATMSSGVGSVTGTPSAWAGSQFTANNFRCENTSCFFPLIGSPAYEFAYLQNSGDTGTQSSPTHATVPVTQATFFMQADRTQPFQMVCSTSGSLVYEPAYDAATHFELSNVSSPVTCPGTAIANDQLDFVADWQ